LTVPRNGAFVPTDAAIRVLPAGSQSIALFSNCDATARVWVICSTIVNIGELVTIDNVNGGSYPIWTNAAINTTSPASITAFSTSPTAVTTSNTNVAYRWATATTANNQPAIITPYLTNTYNTIYTGA
jgi:hypothetical protein